MLDGGIGLEWLLKVLTFYGTFLMHFIYLFAAGMLLTKFKNAYTAMFFFGLLFAVIANIAIRIIIEFRLFDSATDMQHQIQLLSMISAVAYFVQVIGFLLFVFDFIEHFNNSKKQ
jgi:hypothetical protein